MRKTVHLDPTFLPYSKEVFRGRMLHECQVAIRDVAKIKEDCLIVKAPTGSGKTFAFPFPSCSGNGGSIRNPLVVIIEPTNSLVSQVYCDTVKDYPELRLMKWTASDLGKEKNLWRTKRDEIINKLNSSDVIVSNPDIISLFMSGIYHVDPLMNEKEKVISWSHFFRQSSVVVIDEFHSYSEEEMGRIFSFILLGKKTGNTHVKYIFASATPNPKVEQILLELGISYRTVEETPITYTANEEARPLRGEVEITFTDENILDSVKTEIPPKGRILFLCDHKMDAETLRNELLKSVEDSDIMGITGYDTRAVGSQEKKCDRVAVEHAQPHYILATNAAELGLNLDVDISHIEPGRFMENFRQRFGRVARNGKKGNLYVHSQTEFVKLVPEGLISEGELMNELERLIDSRDFYKTKVFSAMGAYLFLVYKSSRPTNRDQIYPFCHENSVFRAFEEFDKAIDKLESYAYKPTAKASIGELRKWWNEYLRAFGFFRGESMEVPVIIQRGENFIETTDDLVWIFRNTEYIKMDDGRYKLIRKLVSPNDPIVKFKAPEGLLEVHSSVLMNRSKFKDMWSRKLEDFLSELSNNEEDLTEICNNVKNLIKIILKPLHPALLPPIEVVIDGDIFL